MFYSPNGLKQVAELLDATVEQISQNELARQAGVSASTIGNLRLHRHNTSELIGKKPDPDTLLVLAPFITDPRTGQPFCPEEFLRVARGHLSLEAPHPFISAVDYLQAQMNQRSLSKVELAERARISVDRLQQILDGDVPLFSELLRLSSQLGGNADELGKLYDLGYASCKELVTR